MFYYLKTFVYFLMAISQFWDLKNVFPMFFKSSDINKILSTCKKERIQYGGFEYVMQFSPKFYL